jgi:hypothetical protein
MKTSEKNLRMALKGNALFSLLSGATLLIYPRTISTIMKVENHNVYWIVGIGLLLFCSYLLFNAYKKELDLKEVKFIIIQDWVWVMGSLAIILIDPFNISHAGNWIIGIVAIAVMGFAIIQSKALKTYRSEV